jgi:hypothetical protein
LRIGDREHDRKKKRFKGASGASGFEHEQTLSNSDRD